MGEQSRPAEAGVSAAVSRSVHYDGAWLCTEIGELLAALCAHFASPENRELLGDRVVAGLQEAAMAIAGRLGSPLHIVVVGDFKRGKSSLINAILRQQVLGVDVLPETIAITELHHGRACDARLMMKDGGYVRIGADELHREALEPLLARYGDQVDRLRLELPLPGQEDVVWVDTPGSGDIFRRFDSAVAAYLDRCDLVIGVLSPHSPLSLSEQTFFRHVLAPRDFPKICFVLNMLDLVSRPGDRQRLAEEVRSRLSKSFPGAQHFALSALDEQARQAGTPRPLADAASELAAGFDLFRQSLAETIACQREAIQAQRAIDLTRKLLVAVGERLELLRAALSARASEVEAALAAEVACRNSITQDRERRQREVDDLLARLAQQARGWVSAFVDRVLAALPAQAAALDTGQVRRHLPLFVADVLRQAISACVDAHIPVARDFLASGLQAEANRHALLVEPSTLAQGALQANLGDLDWDSSHVLHVVAERLWPAGGSLIGGLVGSLGGAGAKDASAKAIKDLLARRSELLTAACETLDAVYARLGAALVHELDAYRDEKLAVIDQALRQAQACQARSSSDTADHLERIRLLGGDMVTFEARLESIRGRLTHSEVLAASCESG
ncbi:MAG: dynamin family protein [Candidatus Accumulibacter sp.]|uniref:dynamin family protein n=1 Tax=Accumulibacter sp. TaxID=2053492 RepID=UPI002878E08B|nr:dynamin family protein [Accumulibacter sp.]MDS4013783.1 dynamin family protein [Accumulibacter sp.]